MWYLAHISASDICSFRELEYTPAQGTTTLIFGHNADNESQRSNGSGKSTLIEAITLGLTGSPLRKVRAEEVINDAAEECRVALTLINRTTAEELLVERTIPRRGTASVRCFRTLDGCREEVAQPSVEAANRYILERLGVTREELFFAFILSRHRYEDFLSASDREKKEIINRFSGGDRVDQAIAQVAADLAPLRDELRAVDLELAGIDGRIGMLAEQIAREEESRTEKELSRREKVAGIQAAVAAKRNAIRACGDKIARHRQHLERIEEAEERLQQFENSAEPLAASMTRVRELLAPLSDAELSDWTGIVAAKNREIAEIRAEIDKWTQIIASIGQKLAVAQAELIARSKEYDYFRQEASDKGAALDGEMQSLTERLSAANTQVEALQRRKRAVSTAVETLHARLAGTVECPACAHRFLVSDRDFDVAAATRELEGRKAEFAQVEEELLDSGLEAEKVEQMITAVRGEIRDLHALRHDWDERMAGTRRSVEAAEYEMEGARFNIQRCRDYVAARTREVEEIRRNLFDEAFDRLGAVRKAAERAIEQCRAETAAAESSIDTLQQTLAEIERATASELIASLKASLKEYRAQSAEVAARRTGIDGRIAALEAQQQYFVQFRTYLANTKIEALAGMINRVLDDIGSDLRVSLSGYTTLKSGAVREKISVSIIRDGLDAGTFGKFSEGERARVNTASVIAMQRLVNGNCPPGGGLDLLCMDEILDAVDADGLAGVFATLGKQALTALVVSHGLVQEGYPHRITIVKEHGESRIERR